MTLARAARRRSLLRARLGRRVALDDRRPLRRAGAGAALPIVLQAFFVVCLRFASGLGTGRGHELHVRVLRRRGARRGHGVLARDRLERAARRAAALVGRARVAGTSSARRCVSFAAVAAAAGVFALVGERIVHAALGPHYEGDAGGEIGRLIVLLGPWMAASIGVTITFPMLFVAGKRRRLPLLAIGALRPPRRR